MKANIVILAILVLPGIAFPQRNFIDQNYIEVKGQAVVKVVPDQIYLRIQISEKQKNRAEMDIKERDMLAGLKNIGIPSEDIVIKDLASNLTWTLFSDDNIVIAKVYVLLLRDAKTVNKVISEMERLEISNIKIEHLDHTKMNDFKKECSAKAMAAAKNRAETLATSIGQSIGRAVYVEEMAVPERISSRGQSVGYYDKTSYSHREGVFTPNDWFITDVDFDEIKIECMMLARFELK